MNFQKRSARLVSCGFMDGRLHHSFLHIHSFIQVQIQCKQTGQIHFSGARWLVGDWGISWWRDRGLWLDQQAAVLDSAHVGVPPVLEGDVGLLHHLRRRPSQDVVWTAGLVVSAWVKRRDWNDLQQSTIRCSQTRRTGSYLKLWRRRTAAELRWSRWIYRWRSSFLQRSSKL